MENKFTVEQDTSLPTANNNIILEKGDQIIIHDQRNNKTKTCPTCGGEYLDATGYCVQCKKSVSKESEEDLEACKSKKKKKIQGEEDIEGEIKESISSTGNFERDKKAVLDLLMSAYRITREMEGYDVTGQRMNEEIMELIDKFGRYKSSPWNRRESKERIKESFHPMDDLMAGITFEELIDTIYSNEPTIDAVIVTRTFNELMRANEKDARYELKTNMSDIIRYVMSMRESMIGSSMYQKGYDAGIYGFTYMPDFKSDREKKDWEQGYKDAISGTRNKYESKKDIKDGWEPDVYIQINPDDLESAGSVTDEQTGETEYVFKHKRYDKFYRTHKGMLYALAKSGRPSSVTNLSKQDVIK